MKRLVVLFLLVVNFTLSSYAQEDRLGLEIASDQMSRKIPVVVTSAIEASTLNRYLPNILNYYFQGRYSEFQSTQLGNELQPRVGDLMIQLGYANIVPNTGFVGVQGGYIKQETDIVRVLPKYVIVPTISFEAIDNSGKVISLGPFGSFARTDDPILNNALGQLSHTNVNLRTQKIRATFTLRFYDQSGTQVMTEEACPQQFNFKDATYLQAGLIYGSRLNSEYTLKPLAVKLMGAMTARLIGRGTCK